jgi:peptidyl-prolyl cis-trans isomerase SurA
MTHCSSAVRPVVVLALVALGIAAAHAGLKAAGQAPAGQAPAKEIIERVLVKVNGDIITQSDLEARQGAAIRGQRVNTQGMTDAQLDKMVAEVTPQLIVEAVDELLLLQRGRELGYKLTDDRFKLVLENLKKENKLETEEQFQAALKSENMTLAELRVRMEKGAIINQVQNNEVMGRLSVSESETKAYYEAHKAEFTTPATMMLREILIAVPVNKLGFSVGQDEAAKAKADALYARLKAGESFEKAVADASEAVTKANGGLIGPISLSDIVPQLRQVLAPLKAGDFTEVLRTQAGYQIYKVDTLSPVKELPWEQAKEEIYNRVGNAKQEAEFAKYLQKVRAQAVIEWKNLELKKLYDQRVAVDLASRAKK